MGRLNDEEIAGLMRAGLKGDRNAYRDLFHSILPMLTDMIRAMAPALPPDLREDVVQEILISIHAKRATWRQDKPILPWIYAIARHRLIDHMRKQKRTLNVDIALDDVVDFAAAPAEPQDLRHDLEKGIRGLNTQTEAVVRSMGIEGKNAKQAGEELGISENAARIAFHRGLKRLRLFLSDDQPKA